MAVQCGDSVGGLYVLTVACNTKSSLWYFLVDKVGLSVGFTVGALLVCWMRAATKAMSCLLASNN